MVQAVPKVVEYVGREGFWEQITAHETELQSILINYLSSRSDVTIRGENSADPAQRLATVSFTIEGWIPQKFVEAVETQSNFAFRWGAFYSNRLVAEVLGLPDGVIRVSMVHYNTGELIADVMFTANEAVDEVKALIRVFDKVCKK